MKYNTHTDIRDPYPSDSNPIDGINPNYIGRGGDFALNGKFKGNAIDWSRQDTANIKVSNPNHTFRFILDIDGQLYTSQNFLDDLQDAVNKNNPYFNLETVAVIPLSLQELQTPNQVYEFGEKYAEVEVTSNLNTGEDSLNKIIDHINWLADSETKELREVSEMGSWNLNTTDFNPVNDTGMGVEFSEDMEKEKKNPPQSTVPNEEVETVVTQTESTPSKAENPNLEEVERNKPRGIFGQKDNNKSVTITLSDELSQNIGRNDERRGILGRGFD